MKKYFLCISFLSILIACQQRQRVDSYLDKETGTLIYDTIPFYDLRDFPNINEETNTDTLIRKMTRLNCVMTDQVGFGGAYTKEYASFERLSQILTEEELFALVKHENAVVRLYAFRWLVKQKSVYLQRARAQLENDSSETCLFSGCMKMTLPLADFVRD